MKIVFRKKDGDVVHKCDVCGRVAFWNRLWAWMPIGVGEGVAAYEIIFKSCSKKCRERDKVEGISKKIQTEKNEDWDAGHDRPKLEQNGKS